MAVVLVIKTEDGQLAELPIIDRVILGRSSSADYKIQDGKMSSQHCAFSLTKKGEVLFEDLASTNGSYLNNSRIHQTLFRLNDVIRVGNTLIKIDTKKLTPKERQSIGTSNLNSSEDKTLPVLPDSQMSSPSVIAPKEDPKTAPKKPTVVLNKDIMKKKPTVQDWVKHNENVIEQEESSGMTKMLKLEKIGEKKKK